MISRFARAFACTTLSVFSLSHACGEELLVLRNGYVISGDVSRVGDHYVIRIAEGSEARIPRTAVEFRCRNLEDAYQRKVGRLEGGRVNERIELVEWCLRHDLTEGAEQQLAASEQLDPLNPRVHQLRRRFDSISETAATSTSVSLLSHRPPADELNLLIRGLPGEAVEEFTTTVQPLLVNRCSSGGCHGPNSESTFRLIRPRPGRALERPFTQRNLHATLQTINRDRPLSSPLAQVLSEPHGPNDSVRSGLSNEQVDRVIRWMKKLSKGNSEDRPATIASNSRTLRQAPKTSRRSARQEKDHRLPSPPPRSNHSTAKPDPFDPEIFNRRYHPRPKANDNPGRQHAAPGPRSAPTPEDFRSSIPRR